MSRVETHFEQVPVEIVKKTAKLKNADLGEMVKPRKKRKAKAEAILSKERIFAGKFENHDA